MILNDISFFLLLLLFIIIFNKKKKINYIYIYKIIKLNIYIYNYIINNFLIIII